MEKIVLNKSTFVSMLVMKCVLLFLLLQSADTFGQSAVVNKVWLEHGTQNNGNKGMTIHADIVVNGMKGNKIESIAYFYDSNKNKLLGGVSGYKTNSGHVCASNYATPSYESSRYSDFDIFIPYNSLPLKDGKHTYYVSVSVLDESKQVFISNQSNYVSFTGTGSGNNSNQNYPAQQKDYGSNISSLKASSLTYKTWESKFDKGYTEYVRESDGMCTETMHMNCVCLNGICNICAGLGVTGYGMFQRYCSYCGGTAKCQFCGGSGTKVITYRYRYIDEYYSNGGTALHVTSSNSGPSVYRGGVGFAYYTYGNSQPIKDEGSYYSFGGETVHGVKMASFRLSKDYKKLWMGNDEYHLIDKDEYDRLSSTTSKIMSGTLPIPNGSSSAGSSSYSSGSSSNRSSNSSVYTKCTTCNGTGVCSSCGGKRGKWANTGYYTGSGSESWIDCGSCRGSGKCAICYGRGKL